MGIAIHTTNDINGEDYQCRIRWRYAGEDNWHGYYGMGLHKFNSKGYGEASLDWCVWYEHMPHGDEHFEPDKQVYYTIWVQYPADNDAYFEGSFYTAPPENTQTLIFYGIGDTQNEPKDSWSDSNGHYYASVMNSLEEDMIRIGPAAKKLLIHCGDLNFNGPRTYYSPAKSAWNREFFGRTCNNNGGNRDKALWVLSHVPVMVTVGNHDWMWDSHPDRNSICHYVAAYPYDMYHYTNNPTNITLDEACNHDWDDHDNPEILYYSFDYGPAHFISLSTFPADDNDHSTHFGAGSHQVAWLKNDLASTDKEWIIVFTHIPLVDGKGIYNPTAFAACEPLFHLYGVDIVLQGHQHFYVRKHYNEIPYLIIAGGGGQLFSSNQSGAEVYCNQHHFWTRFEIVNSDSCRAFTQAIDYYGYPWVVIDDFYFHNRKSKK